MKASALVGQQALHSLHEWDERALAVARQLALLAAHELPYGYWYEISVSPLGQTMTRHMYSGPGFGSSPVDDDANTSKPTS